MQLMNHAIAFAFPMIYNDSASLGIFLYINVSNFIDGMSPLNAFVKLFVITCGLLCK